MVLATTFMFALYPLMAFTQFVLDASGTYSPYVFLTGRIFLTILLVLSVFIVPLNLFSYLNVKRNLDVYHALPIKRKDLFLSTFVSTLIIILIPYTLIYTFGGVYNVLVIADVDGLMLFYNYIYSIIITMAVLIPILFAMMNTGTAIDGFLYSGLLHVIPPIAYGTYLVFGETMLLGFSPNPDLLFVLFSTPIYALFDLNFNTTRTFPNPWAITFYWFVFSLVATWVVLYLYKIRRSEKAENPFTNKWFFPIVVTTLIMVVQVFFYSLFSNFNNNTLIDARTLIFPIVFTFVAYMILDVIAHRGFRHFLKGMLAFAITTVITLSSFVGLTLTRGFGYVTNVPNANNVKEVEVIVQDSLGIYGPLRQYGYDSFTHQMKPMVFDDPQHIEIITQLHQSILDGYKEIDYQKDRFYDSMIGEFRFDNTGSVTLTYTMNTGLTVARTYQTNIQWLDPLQQLFNTPQYFAHSNTPLELALTDNYDITRLEINNSLLSFPVLINNDDQMKQLITHYKEDYLAKTISQHVNKSVVLGFANIAICANQNCDKTYYPIRDDDTKTLNYLKQIGKDISFSNTSQNNFTLLIPPTQGSDFFKNSVSGYMAYDLEVDFTQISYEEALLLTPFIEVGNTYSYNQHVLLIPELTPYPEDINNKLIFITNEANEIIRGILEDKTIEKSNYFELVNIRYLD